MVFMLTCPQPDLQKTPQYRKIEFCLQAICIFGLVAYTTEHLWFRKRFTRDQPPEVTGQSMMITAVRQIWFSREWRFLVTKILKCWEVGLCEHRTGPCTLHLTHGCTGARGTRSTKSKDKVSWMVELVISVLFWQYCEGLLVCLDQFGELLAEGNYSFLDFEEAVTIPEPMEKSVQLMLRNHPAHLLIVVHVHSHVRATDWGPE